MRLLKLLAQKSARLLVSSAKVLYRAVKFTLKITMLSALILSLTGASLFAYTKYNNIFLLTEENSVNFTGVVTEELVDKTIASIKAKLETSDSIYLFIDSPGGMVIPGLTLVDFLQDKKSRIKCVVKFAASMAFSLAQQGCGVIYTTENAIMMQHRLTMGGYTVNELQASINEIRVKLLYMPSPLEEKVKLTKQLNELQLALNYAIELEARLNSGDVARIGINYAEFKSRVNKDWWGFGSEQILKYNFADEKATVFIIADFSSELLDKIESWVKPVLY